MRWLPAGEASAHSTVRGSLSSTLLALVLGCASASTPAATAPQIDVSNWYWGPGNHWSYQHMRRIFPTAEVSRGRGPVAELPYAIRDVDDIVFAHPRTRVPMTIAEMVLATDTDGFLVMKDGKILAERYFNGMGPDSTHLLMSVTKSVIGVLAGIVVSEGRLDPAALVTRYVPELAHSAYAGATVRQLLDMTIGITFDENYASKTSDLYRLDESAGWVPRGGNALPGLHAYLATLTKPEGTHGSAFHYVSANTDVMGWLLERATDTDLAQLLSTELWSKLGAEHDAYIVLDGFQNAYADPGFNATLRDLGRFAQMVLQNGTFNGRRIVADGWIQDIRRNGDPQAWKRSPEYSWLQTLPCYGGGSYRSYWYVAEPRCGYVAAIGLAGQLIVMDPRSGTIVVKFSSQATPDADNDNVAFAGAVAIIQALAAGSKR